MIAVNDRVVVKVDGSQKEIANMGNTSIYTMKEYGTNYRERAPVLAEVFGEDYFLICHHNLFYGATSPFHLSGDYFSIPMRPTTVFCKVDKDGNPYPILGNIICEKVIMESDITLPEEFKKPHLDRVRVTVAGDGYSEGELLFVIKYSRYEICYNWKGEERTISKVFKEDIVGVAVK